MRRPYIVAVILAALLVFLPGVSSLAAPVRVTTTGEAYLANITPEEAQALALKRARYDAVEQVCGVRIQAETLVKDFVLQGDFIHQVAYGRIVGEKVLRWEIDVDQPSPLKPPGLTLRVTMQAEVQPEKGEPDPFYKVKVWLNKSVFESGEEMVVNVNATRDSYITVLNFSADGSVTLLYPNLLRRDNKVEAGRDYEIPAREDRGDLMKFQVATMPGHRQDTEAIRVIATRGPVSLLSEVKAHGNFGLMESTRFAVTEIARIMASIPPRDRAEDTTVYQVVDPRLR